MNKAMKNIKAINFLIIGILFLLTSNIFAQNAVSFTEGLAKGKSENKPILINVYIAGDSWCAKMESVLSNEKIKSLLPNFVFVKLNAGSDDKFTYNGKQYSAGELSKYFGATGYPAFTFLNPDGSIIVYKYNGQDYNSFSGYLDVQDFEKLLNFFINQNYKDTDLSKVM